jgi:predicted small secreted protein
MGILSIFAVSPSLQFHPHFLKEFTMKTTLIAVLSCLTMMLTACNTVKGVGQDIQKAGEKIEDVAKKK